MPKSLIERAPGDLKPNPWNTNIVSPQLEERLENSVRDLGMFKPVVCRELEDGSLEILGGEHRARVAQKLGHATVPVMNLGKISDAQAKKISLVDNARYGADDTLQLASLLKELGEIEAIDEYLPYTDAELASIFAASSIALDDLDDLDTGAGSSEAPAAAPAVQQFQVMRFKVPAEDAERIAKVIDGVMRAQKFTQDDALSNAGNALVWIFGEYAK